jgi:predicted PurR-regulated permease PerM
VRTIAATIAMVLLTAVVLLLGWEVRRVLTWIVVAALLAVILGPLVDLTQRRLHLRRALATLVVFLVALVALAGILTVFVRPLASEGPQFVDRVPAPAAARSGAWCSATTWTSTSSATRRGCARAPTASPPRPLACCARSSRPWSRW